MRQEEQSYDAIAAALEVSVSTVASYLSDPDGSKARARKTLYRGTCSACGRSTNRGRRPRPGDAFVCARCDDDSRRLWTRDRVTAALRSWQEQTGEWPSSYDWTTDRNTRQRRLNSGRAETRERAVRGEALLEAGDYPDPATVRRVFGTLRAAVAAASGEEAATHAG